MLLIFMALSLIRKITLISMYKLFIALALLHIASSSQILNQQSISLTIYNNNFAMVKDVRYISFDYGESFLYFTDVSSNIQTETVTFKATGNPSSIRVYQQNFQRNIVNTPGILKKYLEKTIEIYVELPGSTRKVTGKLLGFDSGYILETNNGIQIFNKIAGIQLASIPDGFFTTPTLNWKVFSESAQTSRCQVAYRTTGFKWKADYSLILNENQDSADLGGWVTIDNNSGKKYVNAKLKLIAGDVNIAAQPSNKTKMLTKSINMKAMAAPAPPSFSEKSFADYHLYTLSKPVTLNQSSQKQVEFIAKVYSIPIEKYHQIVINAGGYEQKRLIAKNFVRFENTEKNGLGIPFPKGIIRVFKEDKQDNSLQFIGQNSINHTPKNENLTVNTGNAFDIVAEKISSSRKSTDNKGGYNAVVKVNIVNHKDREAVVIIKFSNSYADNLRLQMQGQSVAPEKISATQFRWRKTLQPDQKWSFSWIETYKRT